MKKSLPILLFFCLLSGMVMSTHAQQTKAPRFIENIEIVPQVSVTKLIATTNEIKPLVKPNIQQEPIAVVSQDDIEKCTKIQFKYALLMNRDVESLDNTTLYNFIDEWMKTPYQYGGDSKDGIDCSSFASTLMQKVYGVNLPRSSKEQYGKCTKIVREDLQEGDLVFFHTFKGVSHVGVYLGNNYFVHSSTHSGVTIDNLNEEYYDKRYIGGGRIGQ